MFLFQEALCQENQTECTEDVYENSNTSKNCLTKCHGELVTSFDKQTVSKNFIKLMKTEVEQYRKYKGYTKMPAKISGEK